MRTRARIAVRGALRAVGGDLAAYGERLVTGAEETRLELQALTTYRFVRYDNPAFNEQVLNVAEAQ